MERPPVLEEVGRRDLSEGEGHKVEDEQAVPEEGHRQFAKQLSVTLSWVFHPQEWKVASEKLCYLKKSYTQVYNRACVRKSGRSQLLLQYTYKKADKS